MEATDEHVRVDRRLEADLAVLAREDLGTLVAVGVEALERGEHEVRALGRAARRPRRPRPLGRFDRFDGLLGAGGRGMAGHRPIVGAVHRERVLAGHSCAPDQQLRARHRLANGHPRATFHVFAGAKPYMGNAYVNKPTPRLAQPAVDALLAAYGTTWIVSPTGRSGELEASLSS